MKTTDFLLLVLLATGDPARSFTQQSTEPVAVTFRRLQSAAEVDKAAAQLLRQGRSDPKAREYIALHLPSLIEKGPTQKDHPGPWIAVVRLAGQLKIAEAAPALAKWLTIDNIGEMTTAGFTKLETNPAGRALADIGDPAIPATIAVFDNGTLRERRYAVYVLNLINSPSSKNALQEHLDREPDEQLRDFIRKSLSG